MMPALPPNDISPPSYSAVEQADSPAEVLNVITAVVQAEMYPTPTAPVSPVAQALRKMLIFILCKDYGVTKSAKYHVPGFDSRGRHVRAFYKMVADQLATLGALNKQWTTEEASAELKKSGSLIEALVSEPVVELGLPLRTTITTLVRWGNDCSGDAYPGCIAILERKHGIGAVREKCEHDLRLIDVLVPVQMRAHWQQLAKAVYGVLSACKSGAIVHPGDGSDSWRTWVEHAPVVVLRMFDTEMEWLREEDERAEQSIRARELSSAQHDATEIRGLPIRKRPSDKAEDKQAQYQCDEELDRHERSGDYVDFARRARLSHEEMVQRGMVQADLQPPSFNRMLAGKANHVT
jgi:hypothetical protein